MASNYTTNYNLCQWQPTDQVQRTDFNADNLLNCLCWNRPSGTAFTT